MINTDIPFNGGYRISVPKIIWQTGKDNFEDLKYPFNLNVETWKKLNPNWEYRYTNQQEKYDQIKSFGDSELIELSENVPHGVFLADIWRYVTIYQFGGVYADLDTAAKISLDLLEYNHTHYKNQAFIMPNLGKHGYTLDTKPTKFINGKEVHCFECEKFLEIIGLKKYYLTNSAFAAVPYSKPLENVINEIKKRFFIFKELHKEGYDMTHRSLHLCVDCTVWEAGIMQDPDLVASNFIYEYNAPQYTDKNNNKYHLFKKEFADHEILMISKTSYNQFIENTPKKN